MGGTRLTLIFTAPANQGTRHRSATVSAILSSAPGGRDLQVSHLFGKSAGRRWRAGRQTCIRTSAAFPLLPSHPRVCHRAPSPSFSPLIHGRSPLVPSFVAGGRKVPRRPLRAEPPLRTRLHRSAEGSPVRRRKERGSRPSAPTPRGAAGTPRAPNGRRLRSSARGRYLSQPSSSSSQSQQHAARWFRSPLRSTYSQQHSGSSISARLAPARGRGADGRKGTGGARPHLSHPSAAGASRPPPPPARGPRPLPPRPLAIGRPLPRPLPGAEAGGEGPPLPSGPVHLTARRPNAGTRGAGPP